MAATLLINPREAIRALKNSGMPKEQADEVVKIFEKIDVSHLVTRADLEVGLSNLKSELIKFMFLQALGIVGLTVTLVKFL